MLNNFKITTKILLLVALSVMCTIFVVGYSLIHLKETMVDDRKNSIQQVVENAVSIADFYYKQSQNGALSEAEAKEKAKDVIRALRYGNGDYLFVYNVNGITEVHGTRKELEGRQRGDEKDADGFAFIRHQIANAQAGGGFTTYRFTKSGGGDALFAKISYDAPFNPWNWVVATGVYMDDIDSAFTKKVYESLLVVALLMVVLVVASLSLGRVISRPIATMVGAMGKLADGDLNVAVHGSQRRDEIGQMAQAVQVFKDNALAMERLRHENEEAATRAATERRAGMLRLADSFENQMKGIVQGVASQAAQLQSTAASLASGADQVTDQSGKAARAANDAGSGVQVVAAAAEELAASIQEISREVARSADMSNHAVDETKRSGDMVQGLATAASKIGDVVNLISAIASQTNLLALNATIEAARAGEAGKGFAVVAGEVKNLANQTAKATDEIGQQIGAIQTATRDVVGAIEAITGTISGINQVATAIASAVEEQGAATREIARNVQQAATGAQEVSQNVAGVQEAADHAAHDAAQVRQAASDLLHQSDALTQQMDGFIRSIRAEG